MFINNAVSHEKSKKYAKLRNKNCTKNALSDEKIEEICGSQSKIIYRLRFGPFGPNVSFKDALCMNESCI